MGENKKEYHFGAIEDILRESGAEAAEPDRTEGMDGGILLTSGIHMYMRDISAAWRVNSLYH